MKLDLIYQEILVLRDSLNSLWHEIFKRELPKKIIREEDIDRYHRWCKMKEQDETHDFYWIQKIREKLHQVEMKMRVRILNDCKSGKHSLVKIYSSLHDPIGEGYAVVRWCKGCGAIVVDTDYDGRTSPGDIMKMRLPDISKGKI